MIGKLEKLEIDDTFEKIWEIPVEVIIVFYKNDIVFAKLIFTCVDNNFWIFVNAKNELHIFF